MKAVEQSFVPLTLPHFSTNESIFALSVSVDKAATNLSVFNLPSASKKPAFSKKHLTKHWVFSSRFLKFPPRRRATTAGETSNSWAQTFAMASPSLI